MADAKEQRRTNGRVPMSEGHKAALAEGREQGRLVRRYLESLEQVDRGRARAKSAEAINARLSAILEEQVGADPISKLKLIQERLDLERALEAVQDGLDFEAAEADFIKAAGPYGRRKGISYEAWREIGVPASVLREAGISRIVGDEE